MMNLRKIAFTLFLVFGLQICLADVQPADSLVVITGVVREFSHKKKLAGTNLSVPGSNIATISNADGYFSIKIPHELLGRGIKAEHLGYMPEIIDSATLVSSSAGLTIRLQPVAKMLGEVTVYGAEPRSLVERALKKIPDNYSASQNMFSSFYRETVRKGKRYIGVSEAIIDVLKKPYKSRQILGDRVRVVKGRRLVSQRPSDTLAVKIIGGPTLPVVLDVVKNPDVLFSLPELDYYSFKMESPAMIDRRPQYVVSFRPRVKLDYALHKGKIYIDRDNLSFTRLEFSLDMSDKDKATQAILYKKPRGLHFNPQGIDFIVTYKYIDGTSYLNYISTRTRFKCDWKRRLFSSGYTVSAEVVMVDRDDNPATSISRKEAFGRNEVFYDMVESFSDSDFWKDYNIIKPTESLEKAVVKLVKARK